MGSSKQEYKTLLPALQWRLFDLQQALFAQRTPVMVVVDGFSAAGKGRLIAVLSERLDPRGLRVVPVTPPRTQEQQYPWLWRFWLRVPAYGQIVVYHHSWYRRVLIDRLTGAVRKREWRAGYDDILDFERHMVDDGVVLLKFWLNISKRTQAKRFAERLADPLTAWQVDAEDAAEHDSYKRFARFAEAARQLTHRPRAPWLVVDAEDKYAARLTVARALIAAFEERLGEAAPPVVERDKAEGKRQEAEGSKPKAGGGRRKAGGSKQKAGGRRRKAESRRQEAGGRRQKAGGSKPKAGGSGAGEQVPIPETGTGSGRSGGNRQATQPERTGEADDA